MSTPQRRLRILLVEPYLGGSHRAWAEGYRDHSAHEVVLVSHEPRFWKWRMHGAFVTLAEAARDALAGSPPDAVVISDMTHAAALVGALRRELAGCPMVLYMHENQLTYPATPGAPDDLAYAVVNWGSMTAADLVVFNSEFHREVWMEGLPGLLRHFPDHRHLHLVDGVAERTTVLPVGVDFPPPSSDRGKGPPLILWNQRWEYDKAPDAFFAAMDRLAASGRDFRVAIAGENFRQQPAEFTAARNRLGDRVIHFGFAERPRYESLLGSADIVVSTALHEFFGVAVVEAIGAGALPVLPNRLAYPGHIPPALHGDVLYDDRAGLDRLLQLAIDDAGRRARLSALTTEAVRRYAWDVVAPAYDEAVARLAAAQS